MKKDTFQTKILKFTGNFRILFLLIFRAVLFLTRHFFSER